MTPMLTDAQIESLISEGKQLPRNFWSRVHPKATKKNHSEANVQLTGDDGSSFEIRVRQSQLDPLDFSVILAVLPSSGGRVLLRRYNGCSHEHSNRIEGEKLEIHFHIHQATERYQQRGFSAEAYAQITDRYENVHGALQCLIDDCACRLDETDRRLF